MNRQNPAEKARRKRLVEKSIQRKSQEKAPWKKLGLFMALFATLAIGAGVVSTNLMTTLAEAGDATNDNIATDMAVLNPDGTSVGTAFTLYGDSLGVTVRYDLNDLYPNKDQHPVPEDKNGKYIYTASTYDFAVPEELKVDGATTWPIMAEVSTGVNKQIGTAIYDNATKKIHVQFDYTDGDLYDGTTVALYEPVIEYTAVIDESKWSSSDPDTKSISFTANNTTKVFDLTYGGPTKPVASTIEKKTPVKVTGETDADGNPIYLWTVEYTEGNDTGDGTLSFDDTMQSTLRFVANSFTADGVAVADSSSDLSITASNTKITYVFPRAGKGTKHTFTYKTVLKVGTVLQKDGGGNYSVKNGTVTVSGTNNAQVRKTGESGAIVTATPKTVQESITPTYKITDKTGESISINKETDTAVFRWTVTINTNGNTFTNVVLHDTSSCIIKGTSYPAGKTPTYQVSNDIKVAQGNPVVPSGAAKTPATFTTNVTTPTAIEGGNRYQTDVTYNLGTINGEYKIYYESTISNYSYYSKYSQGKVINEAYMTFNWPDSEAGDAVVKGPTMKKESKSSTFDASAGSVKKTGVYNAAEHTIDWTIQIDGSVASFDENTICIYDYLNGGPYAATADKEAAILQEMWDTENLDNNIVDVRIRTALNGTIKSIPYNKKVTKLAEDLYKLEITDPDTGKSLMKGNFVEIVLRTKLKDSEADVYESNAHGVYALNAIAAHETEDMSNVVGKVEVKSKVISKEPVGYDYSNHLAAWKITVNQSGMYIADARVQDKILIGGAENTRFALDALDEDHLISNVPSATEPYYEYDGTYFTVHLGPIHEQHEIYVVTDLFGTDGNLPIKDFEGNTKTMNGNSNETIKIKNHASFWNGTHKRDYTADYYIEINNSVVEKSGIPLGDGMASYTVELNKTGARWPVNAKVTDVLDPGLSYDQSSVALYKATVNMDGSMTKVGSKIDAEVTFSGDASTGESFEIIMPTTATSTDSFILEYIVNADTRYNKTAAEYNNSVTVTGFEIGNSAKAYDISGIALRGSGHAYIGMTSIIKVVKTDEDDPSTLLAGAVFELRNTADEVVDIQTTNAQGVCFFSGLDPDTEYKIVETVAPEGYKLAEAVTVTSPSLGDAKYLTDPIKVTDKKKPTTPGGSGGDGGSGSGSGDGGLGSGTDGGANAAATPNAAADPNAVAGAQDSMNAPKMGDIQIWGIVVALLAGIGLIGGVIFISRKRK